MATGTTETPTTRDYRRTIVLVAMVVGCVVAAIFKQEDVAYMLAAGTVICMIFS